MSVTEQDRAKAREIDDLPLICWQDKSDRYHLSKEVIEAIAQVIADTREADAKKCDAISLKAILSGDRDRGAGAIECAAAIRAQPETVEVSLPQE